MTSRSASVGRRSDEGGTTLVELIVTIVIMGFAMLALMGGIGTSIIFADVQRQDTTAQVVLTTAAEKIASETDPNKYVVCADTYPAPPSPSGYTLAVTKVLFWEPASNRFVAKAALSSCIPPVNPGDPPAADNGLQLIELKVTSASGQRAPETEVLEVVKRQVET